VSQAQARYVVACSLPLRYCSLSPAPLHPSHSLVGHADDSVAQQLQMPSLQQGGTRWHPASKEVRRPVKTHCP
jgi:hypothetical protein